MSGTFEDVQGRIYPVSRIVMIVPDQKASDPFRLPRHQVYLDFREEAADVSSLDEIVRHLHSPVPAAPGYNLLTFWYDPRSDEPRDEPHIEVRPVIAWRLDGPNGHHPVVVRDDYDRDGLRYNDALEDVTGQVTDAELSRYQDRADWASYMKARREREVAEKAGAKVAGASDD